MGRPAKRLFAEGLDEHDDDRNADEDKIDRRGGRVERREVHGAEKRIGHKRLGREEHQAHHRARRADHARQLIGRNALSVVPDLREKLDRPEDDEKKKTEDDRRRDRAGFAAPAVDLAGEIEVARQKVGQLRQLDAAVDQRKEETKRGETEKDIVDQARLSALLKDGRPSVVPGFYGAREDGEVVTFSRGGSGASLMVSSTTSSTKTVQKASAGMMPRARLMRTRIASRAKCST